MNKSMIQMTDAKVRVVATGEGDCDRVEEVG